MKKFLLAASAIGSVIAAVPALAQTEYHFSGSFAEATGTSFTALLGGGSFDGSYTLTGDVFPTSGVGYFDSFTVNLRDAAGDILLTMMRDLNQGWGYINTAATPYYGGVPIYFYDQAGADYLQLIVPVGFSGTGTVLTALGTSYAQIAPQNQATVTSGVIGVPEPAAWGLLIGGFGMLGTALRARRARIAYAA